MKVPFANLKAQYLSIKEEMDAAIKNVIENTAFIGGKGLKDFERNFADYLGTKECVGVGNGTDALFVALKSLDIGSGDEVITAANSFIATSEAITMTGASVVFVDCDEQTYNIDVSKLGSAVTERTKAIIPVHIYGQSADMDPIMDIAKKHGLYVVEDAAQAHGAKYGEATVGTIGDSAAFSFYPGKNLGAYGDGGAITTDNEKLAKRQRMFANHGRAEKFGHEFEGINSRLDGLQAAVLDVKLKHLEEWTECRRRIAAIYDKGLAGVVTTPYVMDGVRHVYHLYVVRVKDRDRVRAALGEAGVSTGIHYPTPLPYLQAYKYLGHTHEDFPVAWSAKDELLSLPIHGNMTDEEAAYVIEKVKEIIK